MKYSLNVIINRKIGLGFAIEAKKEDIQKFLFLKDKYEMLRHIDYLLKTYKLQKEFFANPAYEIDLEKDFSRLHPIDLL